MVTGQPALRDAITPLICIVRKSLITEKKGAYILNHVAVITNEEVSAAIWQIDLHPNQPIGVAWQMMQRDTLAKVERPLIEGFPIPNLGSA